MDPLTVGIGVQALASVAQIFQSEKARGESRDNLNKIQEIYDRIAPPDYNVKITDPPELHAEALQQPKFANALQGPQFNLTKLTPQDYKVIGQYNPQAASFIQQNAPKTIEQTGDMKQGRAAQMAALQKFMEVGKGDYDPEYQQAVQEASKAAQGQAQSRQQSLMQDFARRGQLGSGAQMAAQIGAGSQAMNQLGMSNLSAASQAYKNKLGALAQGAGLGAQINQQDVSQQGMNANIINQFNQQLTASRQQYENNRANMMNQAQLQNLQAGQDVANKNTLGANQAQLHNQQRGDELAKYGYNVSADQQARNDQLAKYQYGNQLGAQQYKNQIAQQQYQNQLGQQQYQNQLKSQAYNDQLGKAGIRAGVSTQASALGTQQAQDRNQAVQGLANIGSIYASNQMGQNYQNERMANQTQVEKAKALSGAKTPEEEDRINKAWNGVDSGSY